MTAIRRTTVHGTGTVKASDAIGPRVSNYIVPERLEDLRGDWAELTEAARGSEVIDFHACTRSGQPWVEDSAAVRAAGATLREFPAVDEP